jgi:NAD(P)H-dependent FMN reductase
MEKEVMVSNARPHGGDPGSAARPSRPRVGVIVGSTRPTRICAEIAALVTEHLGKDSTLSYTTIDLAEVDLPFLDEPRKPALGGYEHDHTKAWSETVSSFQGFVLVFPQYNWGYPAPLKNALDFLYAEWRDKPAALVTYGSRGGARAAEQLRMVLTGLHMQVVADGVQIKISEGDVDGTGQLVDARRTLAGYLTELKAVDAHLSNLLTSQ